MKLKLPRPFSLLMMTALVFVLFAAIPLTNALAVEGTGLEKITVQPSTNYAQAKLHSSFSEDSTITYIYKITYAASLPNVSFDLRFTFGEYRYKTTGPIVNPLEWEIRSVGSNIVIDYGTEERDGFPASIVISTDKLGSAGIYEVRGRLNGFEDWQTFRIEVTRPAASATINPTSVTFVKNSSGDITITVDTAGLLAQSIKNGSYELKAGTDFVVNSITSVTLKAAYLNTLDAGTHTLIFNFSGGTSLTLTVTVTGVAPTITGPTTMTLAQGYAATSTGVYTVSGTPAPTVAKTSGDSKITWNDGTKKLDIAAGLTAGTYQVILMASNGIMPDATLTFTLTVTLPSTPSTTTQSVTTSVTPGTTTSSTTTSSTAISTTPGTTTQPATTSVVTTTGGTDNGGGNTFDWRWVAIIALSVTVVICLIVIIVRK